MKTIIDMKSIVSLPDKALLRAYVATAVLIGIATGAVALRMDAALRDPLFLTGLIIAAAASERFKIGLFGDSHVSLSAAACMTAGLAGGPADAAIVAVAAALACNLGGVVPLYKTATNVSIYVAASVAFVGVVRVFGVTDAQASWPWALAPAITGAAVYFFVNTTMVAVAVSIANERRLTEVIGEKYVWLFPHYLPLGVLAAGLAAAQSFMGSWALVAFAASAVSMQVALAQYSLRKAAWAEEIQQTKDKIRLVEAELARMRAATPSGGQAA